MNKVYESPRMVVHDDRTPLTLDQAFEILFDGGSIRACYPPDFSAENEADIFDSYEQIVWITDIVPDKETVMPRADWLQKVFDYLRTYELYR